MNKVQLGYEAYMFNLKKHTGTYDSVKEDFDKDYELLYHKAVKTAHLERIKVYFIAPSFKQSDLPAINDLLKNGRTIKRRGCKPCEVTYELIRYETLASKLLKQLPEYIVKTFLVEYGRNVIV